MRAVGTAHGSFCKQCRIFNGEPHPRGRRPGLFTSEAEFSKGYRRFASVITLAKCGSAAKARYRCENWARRTGTVVETAHSAARPGSDAHGPGGTAVKTAPAARVPHPPGRRGSHWGRLAALEQVNPHWGRLLTCPNDPFPTPIGHYLPQCGRASAHGHWRTGTQAHAPTLRNHRPQAHPRLPGHPRTGSGRRAPTDPRPRLPGHLARSQAGRTHGGVCIHPSPDSCEPADDNDCITVVPKRFRRARGCPYSGPTALLPGAPLTAPSAAGVPPRTGRSRGLQAERPRAQHSG